ncbi:bmt2, partial [Symbiodinium natans]
WVRYDVKGRTLYWNPKKMKMETRAPVGTGEEKEREPPAPRDPPVRLLDIGSNTNSFLEWPFYVTPYALDLQPNPVAEGVFQADFFDVPIVEAPDASEPLILDDEGKLKGIVAGSMDVVVICLVLSCLPTPEKRIEMVAKARKCLREDRGLLIVVEGAAAIVEASWHQQDEAAVWSKAMESAGFKALMFNDYVREGRRKKRTLQWILETAPLTDGELKPLRIAKEMEY